MEVRSHLLLKKLWCEELRHQAVGEEQGRVRGRWLAALEAGLLVQEDHLEQQHHQLMQVRLAAVKEASGLELDEPGAPPPTVLQTYAVPLQRVRQEPRATTLGAAHDGQIPVLDRCHEGVESNYNGVGEGPAV